MKKIIFAVLLFCSVSAARAQVMAQKAVWVTISVPQMKCWECKDRLEKYLARENGPADESGIMKVIVNMTSGSVRVQYAPDRINVETIKTSINNAGYDADSTKATPDSYAKLPPVCKRAAEGGGQQKGAAPCKLPPGGGK